MKLDRTAIVTVTVGEKFRRIASVTHPLLKDYADKCNADLIVFNQQTKYERHTLASYDCVQMYELFNDYDRIAFVDTDMLVSTDSPSVFELTPETHVGACSDERYSHVGRSRAATQKVLGEVKRENAYFNVGMMVLSRRHKELINPYGPGLCFWPEGGFRDRHRNLLNDQSFMNNRLIALGFEVHDLGYRFNHTYVIPPAHTRFRSHFIHYAGLNGYRYSESMDQIAKDARVLRNRLLLELSRRSLTYRWIADRMTFSFIHYLMAGKLSRSKAKN